jgi:exopolysaccharide production protein ExoY
LASVSYAFLSESERVRRSGQSDRFGAKRLFDIMASIAGIIFLAPLLVVIAILVWGSGKGSVIYSHPRVGYGGQLFRCFKFRTMRAQSDEYLSGLLKQDPAAREEWLANNKIRRDPRVTKFGRFLRRTSIDELPQLFNVLKGDMSLVGPRPIVVSEIPRYGHYISNYWSVKPGITGLWQVSRRSDTTYRRRVAYDVIYGRRQSFSMDARILLRTIVAIVGGEGCY